MLVLGPLFETCSAENINGIQLSIYSVTNLFKTVILKFNENFQENEDLKKGLWLCLNTTKVGKSVEKFSLMSFF